MLQHALYFRLNHPCKRATSADFDVENRTLEVLSPTQLVLVFGHQPVLEMVHWH